MNKSRFLSALKFVLSFLNWHGGSTWFKFSYTWLNGTSVIGIVRGNLQADKNTVINLSSVLAFVKNSDGIFISEFLDILILGANNHLTLDGSSLEFAFTSSTGDSVKFLGSTSDFLFTSSVIIDNVRVISFEPINPANWNMVQCFLNKSQYHLIDEVRNEKNNLNYKLKFRE
ncbi:MAG: hypothetical protein QNJ60_13960 [Xenococcaceae cyanobacterium MO_188.B19]|nr:hypothetical protein [Xenococcaceae cyanobacterium MO_188.B19]